MVTIVGMRGGNRVFRPLLQLSPGSTVRSFSFHFSTEQNLRHRLRVVQNLRGPSMHQTQVHQRRLPSAHERHSRGCQRALSLVPFQRGMPSCFAFRTSETRASSQREITSSLHPWILMPILAASAGAREVARKISTDDSERFNGDSTTTGATQVSEVINIRPPVLRFITAFVVVYLEANEQAIFSPTLSA